MDPVRAIADAVLYEGYILWPYTRSAMKNQRRFTFGGVYPPRHAAEHPDDRPWMLTGVLFTGPPTATVQITVRFLQVVRRAVARLEGEVLEQVDELSAGSERYLAWEEAVERELHARVRVRGVSSEPHLAPIAIPAGSTREVIHDGERQPVGALIRSWQELRGELQVSAARLDESLWRLSAKIVNNSPFAPGSRQDALEHTFCSTHTVLRSRDGAFVSLADPPEDLVAAAAGCENVGTWPVPVGEPGDRTTILSSPIILEDYPRIAPESPGDLFDGGEIDQLLVLNILALTDEEKAEMAATDPRAREILERTEALTPEQLMALHGTVRESGAIR
jgi:hypothetical protein